MINFYLITIDADVGSFNGNSLKLRVGRESLCFLGGAVFKNGEEKGCKRENERKMDSRSSFAVR